MMVKTPMMMPRSVRKVLSLFDERDPIAIDADSFMLTLAIVVSFILHYLIRKRKELGFGVASAISQNLCRKECRFFPAA
jgi:hypothetical protein